MTATALLADLAAHGIELRVTDRGTLRYQGDKAAVHGWLPQIRKYKTELIGLLRNCHPPDIPPLSAEQRAAITEAIGERAAIMEHDGGLTRQQAEVQAAHAMRVYRYRVTDHPNDWLTLIAPGSDLDDARKALIWRFGEQRLIEVREAIDQGFQTLDTNVETPPKKPLFSN
ncbi:hypothetical protein G3480_05420 [Thiorhodococcus mannitoliphagus]|uniref:TubC N-terminal docking domain-containing protein n=1 Tax=Thiorhodococcus mannitoliphagus TaxID=329406 RepID=A0A6P1DP41_9GAMM|nr:hypothetical protein [Thiorhodococcus mannitoliphagus]NEX19758.1 hypothetical protein [Thiorhodococcus mannitoliphagus]